MRNYVRHGVSISVVGQKKGNLIVNLPRYLRKSNSEVQRNFKATTTLVTLLEIHLRSLFFGVEKIKQCNTSYDNSLRSFVLSLQLFSGEILLSRERGRGVGRGGGG